MEGSIVLPEHLVGKVKKKIEGTDFTIQSYVAHLVEQSFSELDDEQKVKERLKSLGYLD
jgi:hypothetical protein